MYINPLVDLQKPWNQYQGFSAIFVDEREACLITCKADNILNLGIVKKKKKNINKKRAKKMKEES